MVDILMGLKFCDLLSNRLKVWGLGFRVQVRGLRVEGLGLRV